MAPSEEPRQTILIIGPSQNGKSTLINRLNNLSVKPIREAKEGDGSFKQTTNCEIYDIDVPTTDYRLVDIATGRPHSVPDVSNEEKIYEGNWFRKQTRAKFSVEPCDPRGPVSKLRLIDTPGLDDSDGKDFENLDNVMTMLNTLAKDVETKKRKDWERKIAAIVLVYNANSAFSNTFQTVLKDYRRSMPSLFRNLIVVNTHFSMVNLANKRQHLIRDKLMGSNGSARGQIIKDRRKQFSKILGDDFDPPQFFIDNKPRDTLAYDELVSRNTISQILSFLRTCQPMEIKQMRLAKNQAMQAIDKQLQSYLHSAITQWESQKVNLLSAGNRDDRYRVTLQQQKQQLEDTIKRIDDYLAINDNEDEFPIKTYYTNDDLSAAENFGRFLIRRGVRGSLPIQEDAYKGFKVRTQNDPSGVWTAEIPDLSKNSWKGEYEGKAGKTPRLIARSYTTNRVANSKAITEKNIERRKAKADLGECQSKWDRDFGVEAENTNPELNKLVKVIAAGQNWIEILGDDSPPLDKAYNEINRVRYGKQPHNIDHNDLIALARVAEPDLVKPLILALC